MFAWIHYGAPSVRRRRWRGYILRGANSGGWVHSVSRGFTAVHLGIGFIRVRVGSLGYAYISSSGSLGLPWVHSSALRGRRVHSGLRGFTRAHVVVVGFIRVLVDSLRRTPRGRRVHSVSRRFTLVRLVVVGYIRVCLG